MRTNSGACHLAVRSLAVALPLAILVIPAEASRVFFADQSVIGLTRGAVSVFAADIDNDGDTDAIAASVSSAGFLEPSLILYLNDGNANHPTFTARSFNTPRQPSDPAEGVFAADLDGDGDLDIIATLFVILGPGVIEWHENDGGSPPGFKTHLIGTNLGGWVVSVAADFDGDGDLDVAGSSLHDDKIAWYANDGASPPSFTEHVITIDPDGFSGPLAGFVDRPFSIFSADVNGDGRLDLLSASFDNRIAWYENDGATPPSFTPHNISFDALGARAVAAADLDHDGDTDVISASYNDDKIAWYENDGAPLPSFVERVVTEDPDGAAGPLNGFADGPVAVFVTDLDCDGHPDIVFASQIDNRVGWLDNYGSDHPKFKLRTISTDVRYAASVFAADVNGDGHVDVLSASAIYGTIAWYENLLNPSRCREQEGQVP